MLRVKFLLSRDELFASIEQMLARQPSEPWRPDIARLIWNVAGAFTFPLPVHRNTRALMVWKAHGEGSRSNSRATDPGVVIALLKLHEGFQFSYDRLDRSPFNSGPWSCGAGAFELASARCHTLVQRTKPETDTGHEDFFEFAPCLDLPKKDFLIHFQRIGYHPLAVGRFLSSGLALT